MAQTTKRAGRDRPCKDCPHNGDAVLANHVTQNMEAVIEAQAREIERLRVCVTCAHTSIRYQECLLDGSPSKSLEHCHHKPSRYEPYWADEEGPKQ